MAAVIDLGVMLEERRRMLDQVDRAIAEIHRLFAPLKQRRRKRQLRLPLDEPAPSASRNTRG
jgi:hypothetical protein